MRQDWTNVFLGLWLVFSPWVLLPVQQETTEMIANCIISGLLIAGFSLWAGLSKGERWQEEVVIVLGIWLFIAPGTLHYTVPIITWDNVLIGFSIAAFALASLERRKKAV